RLANFTIKVLDSSRRVVFERKKNKAPKRKVAFGLGKASPERIIRRAAMKALPTMRGHEGDAVKALAAFLKTDADRHDAVRALQRIPARQWPADQAKPVLDNLLTYIRKVPVKERTANAVLD